MTAAPHTSSPRPIPGPWGLIGGDPWLLAFVTWLPLFVGLLLWMIFSQGIVRELPIGLVDLDHSTLSRQAARYLDAGPGLKITGAYPSTLEAKKALQTGRIYAYAVIPYNLEKDVRTNRPPQITLFYNTQFILIGKRILSTATQSLGTLNAKIAVGRNLAKGNREMHQAMGQALPIRAQITPLFNAGTNYAQFLVSGILPALWQVFIVAGTVLTLASAHRRGILAALLEHRPVSRILLTLGNLFPFFFIQGLAFLSFFYQYLGWPMHGSWPVLITAQAVMAVVCMVIGALFYFLTMDAPRAVSLAGVFTAPGFAFMGVTFPKSDMSPIALAWGGLLPVSHYIEIQIGQANYGLPVREALAGLQPLAWGLFPLVLLVILILVRAKKFSRSDASCPGSTAVETPKAEKPAGVAS